MANTYAGTKYKCLSELSSFFLGYLTNAKIMHCMAGFATVININLLSSPIFAKIPKKKEFGLNFDHGWKFWFLRPPQTSTNTQANFLCLREKKIAEDIEIEAEELPITHGFGTMVRRPVARGLREMQPRDEIRQRPKANID
ncbi:hypothetical protein B0J14DRAFT_697578 [Halenospora varia]|nr:hypothetical protein B0J14DRAFT_697578 [Halenospora varia]